MLAKKPMPFNKNPLKSPYISVCTSSRCLPSQHWQPTFESLKAAVEKAGLDLEVRTSGCLEVCKLGPVVCYSEDRTWYTRVHPKVAETIVEQHLIQGLKVEANCYPPLGEKNLPQMHTDKLSVCIGVYLWFRNTNFSDDN